MLKMITSLSHFNGFLSQITLHWTNKKKFTERIVPNFFFSLFFSINWLNLLPVGPVINLLSIMFLSANEFYIRTCTQSQWSFDIVFFLYFKYLQTIAKCKCNWIKWRLTNVWCSYRNRSTKRNRWHRPQTIVVVTKWFIKFNRQFQNTSKI